MRSVLSTFGGSFPDFVAKEDRVEPLALDLEGSATVPEPSEVSQVPSSHFSSHRSV